MSKPKAVIKGISGYVPDDKLTNADLEKIVETNDEWIVSRTGIKERRILKGDDTGTSHLAVPAVKDLLKKTNTDPLDVELIICATTTPDYVFPATGNIIAYEVGASNSFSYDLNAACSGFIYALQAASMYIESGHYKKVILVGADKMTSIVDFTDRKTCVIFGDGGGALLLEAEEDSKYGIQNAIMHVDGSGFPYLHQKAGGSRKPATHETVDKHEHCIYQEGNVVFKEAVKKMAEVTLAVMEKNQLTADDVDWLVPHQANKRIIDATAARMGLDADKVTLNIQRYGNTTNATIPLCLWEYENQFKKGDNMIMAAFGGGFTWGALYLKWAYDG